MYFELGMIIIVFVISGLFNATGIGGGSLFVAFLIFAMKYDTKIAIGISYSILFGGSLAKTSFSVRLRNEESGKPLINYGVAMILIPAMLVGSIIGLYLNNMCPNIVIMVCMILLLLSGLIKIFKKARQTFHEEQEEKCE